MAAGRGNLAYSNAVQGSVVPLSHLVGYDAKSVVCTECQRCSAGGYY